jgi:serpin B
MHRDRAHPLLVLLAVVALVAGCGDTGSPSPSVVPNASGNPPASAALTPSATATVTPAPTLAPTPTPAALAPGSIAVTVVDRLPLLSTPRAGPDSAVYQPYLPAGTTLEVVEGPLLDSGYRWYHVKPTSFLLAGGATEGWVAEAGPDGTAWLALAEEPLVVQVAKSEVARAPASPAEAAQAATSINAFGLDLYRLLRAGSLDKNLVFSPTSIAVALAMAWAGARGETAAQMDAVLHANGWDALASGLNSLDQALASRNGKWEDEFGTPHALSLRIANAAFGQQGLAIEPDFLDAIATAFGAGINLVDFLADPAAARETINDWVSRQTELRIPELLGEPDVTSDTRLVLVNAVYLKGNWLVEFGDTQDRPFRRTDGSRVQVPTMSLRGEQAIPYATGPGWKATQLPIMGPDGSTPLAMTLILPDDMAAFEGQLTSSRLGGVISTLNAQLKLLGRVKYSGRQDEADCGTYAYSLNLSMPRFGIDTRAELAAMLEALGMRLAFSPSTADFTGIATPPEGPLYVSAVVHQANIDVDEKGVEAAAATAVVMSTGGCTGPGPAKEITLRLDRPFLFVLRDVQTGAILFMGRVADPSTRE